jgi:hypothetical protein
MGELKMSKIDLRGLDLRNVTGNSVLPALIIAAVLGSIAMLMMSGCGDNCDDGECDVTVQKEMI